MFVEPARKRRSKSALALRAMITGLLVLAFAGVGASTAMGQVGLGAVPDPTPADPDTSNPVTVGQTIAYGLRIQNISNPANGAFRISPGDILMTPSCGSIPAGAAPPCPNPDLNVFSFSATGVGQAGGDPSCVGTTFQITPVAGDPGGRIRFTSPGSVILAASNAGTTDECTIIFAATVQRAPSTDAVMSFPGTQTGVLGEVTGTPVAGGLQASGFGSAAVTVARNPPTIRTVATASAAVGGQLTDNATIENLVNPLAGSTVDFRLYGPDDTNCTRAFVYESRNRPVTLSGTTGTANAASYTPTAPGVYRWRAFFSGDNNNADISGPCNAANENSTVPPPGTPPPGTPPPGTPPPPGPPPSPQPCIPRPGPTPLPPGRTLCGESGRLPARGERGTARISGQTGCVTRNFNVTVTGRHIRQVSFFLDGRRVATLRRPNAGSRYRFAVRPGTLRLGQHRILARTTFTQGSGTPARTLRVVFQRCGRSAQLPQFTG